MRKKKGFLTERLDAWSFAGGKSEPRSKVWGHTRFPMQVDSCMYETKNKNFRVVYKNGILSLEDK